MSVTSSGRQKDWSDAQFLKELETIPILIPHVTSVDVDMGGGLIERSGDNDMFTTAVYNDVNRPRIMVNTDSVRAAILLPSGTRGTFSARQNDARNRDGPGAIDWVFSPAISQTFRNSGRHQDIAACDLNFWGEAPDGVTSPLSYTLI